MKTVIISAILWRKVNKATVDTLDGTSAGQYDIRLNKNDDYLKFFKELAQVNPTANGGFDLQLPLQPIDSAINVPAAVLTVRYMGPSSARQDWYIASQRPTTAYLPWRLTQAVPGVPSSNIYAEEHYIVILKDQNNEFHGRWLTPQDVSLLDGELQAVLAKNDHGVYFFPELRASDQAVEVYRKLLAQHNVLLYGPPGTGKSHVMQEVIHLFRSKQYYVLDRQKEHQALTNVIEQDFKVLSNWVTFHQSYSYEEFIVSLKPNPSSDKLFSLEPVAGTLLELSEFARQDGHAALLAVDEINRGNVSRIFGEFITLLEPDKRLNDNNGEHFGTVNIKLPYMNAATSLAVKLPGATATVQVPVPYTMPYHLYIMASMNSVDKSTTPIDAALRRRFHIVNMMPDPELLAKAMGVEPPKPNDVFALSTPVTDQEEVKLLALHLMSYLNDQINHFLGQDYQFGQWYFKKMCRDFPEVSDSTKTLAEIWKFQLFPQLEEYFIGRPEQLINILRLDERLPEGAPLSLVAPSEISEELGARPILRVVATPDADILVYLAYLVS